MSQDPRLLVVDDEEAICEGCRRIFSRQGFQVEKSSDAQAGLDLAQHGNYSAILLDIKMPTMSGIEFLEQLRPHKPEVPVILMTGYPSVPNAISAIRLGAAAYVTKPFTPEEISKAVHEHLQKNAAVPEQHAPEPWVPAAEGYAFWNEAWVQHGQDGSSRAGTIVLPSQANNLTAIRLPKVGEAVYQGLPMAEIQRSEGGPLVVPAPVSGVVVAVNEALAQDVSPLAHDPCGAGWIAAICPTRFEEEMERCTRRRVLLLNANASRAQSQSARLAALGYQVRTGANYAELASPLQDERFATVIVDAASLGNEGPGVVAQINASAGSMKVILAAPQGSPLEAAYRAQRIFYYAVEAFADNEIAEVLESVFRTPPAPAKKAPAPSPSGNIATIHVVNRNGTKVRILPEAGLLNKDAGLGLQLRQKLLARLLPVETILGDSRITPNDIMKVAATCNRVVVLLLKDVGRLPGTLVRDTKSEFVSVSGSEAGNVTTLVIQPDCSGSSLEQLDARTLSALAEHLVNDLASY